MTDTTDSKGRNRRPSILRRPSLSAVQENDTNNLTNSASGQHGSTIAALITSTPLYNSDSASAPTDNNSINSTTTRPRRRSSVSILQSLFTVGALLPTENARKRSFLVGGAQHAAQDAANDISSCFPNGRLLTIMVVTWNTGEQSKLYEQNYIPEGARTIEPKERMLNDMSDILLPTFIDYVADLIIVCTQEMSVAKKRIDWEILLQEVIGPTHVLFHSVHFGTLSLCIFLRRDLIWFCSEPEEDIVKFRTVGAIRTKGSIVVTFHLFGTSFMIINSHFEAGEGVEGRLNRRSNFQNTMTKISIPHDFAQRTGIVNQRETGFHEDEHLKKTESLEPLNSKFRDSADMTKSCDCVLWAGDLNFRVDMAHADVVNHCKEENYSEILKNDEFRSSQNDSGDMCANFKESTINFPPTYKFDLRQMSDSYSKSRTPSYTDRILYRDKPTSKVECTEYKSIDTVRHSDHKPVIAHFRIKLKPGLYPGTPSYGKFNHDVYRRGCEQRQLHRSLGVGVNPTVKRRINTQKSSVCTIQ